MNNRLTWSKQIEITIRERGIQIVNYRSESQTITENKILIEFVAEYIKENEIKNNMFD